jgi:LAO/AO transport system kinase
LKYDALILPNLVFRSLNVNLLLIAFLFLPYKIGTKYSFMKRFDLSYYINGLKNNDTVVLARAITLMESKKVSDQKVSEVLLDKLLAKETRSLRIGITGTPGVGKSSFIESFGNFLTKIGKKVAVLAVDPSSQRAGGSILGDKTRMETLSTNPHAYIRPSASGHTLGGVNNSTRESILLCEAAGYDVVIVETVGVGQSETMVYNMVDFFLLMIQPGSGDDLQGIKKGIMEMAHGIAINKADGTQADLAKISRSDLLSALHLFAPEASGWYTQVQLCSAIEKTGLEEVWKMITDFYQTMYENGFLEKNRNEQNAKWFEDRIGVSLFDRFLRSPEIMRLKQELSEKIILKECSVASATAQIVAKVTEMIKEQDL